MEKQRTLQSEISDILRDKDYHRLLPYKESSRWASISRADREILAEAFIRCGQDQLERGDEDVYQTFEIASKLAPTNPSIWYQQGVALAHQDHSDYCLTLADQAFLQSSACDPSSFPTWHKWGQALSSLGALKQETKHLVEADEKFNRGLQVLKGKELSAEEIYWPWARCWACMAQLSGEAVDWSKALDKFEKAVADGVKNPTLWMEYGDATVELAHLVESRDLINKAILCYQKAAEAAPDNAHFAYILGLALKDNYEYSTDTHSLQDACAAFEQATRLDSERSEYWLAWGQLLSSAAKIYRETEWLERSMEALSQAHRLDPKDASTLYFLAEVQMIIGAQEERLDLLRNAEENVLRSLEFHSEDPDVWYIYGSILNELGCYFKDVDYYHQAIDRLQYGLGLAENHPMLWYGLAQAHLAIGTISGDCQMLEKAATYCGYTVRYGGDKNPQFWSDWGLILTKLGDLTHQEDYFVAAVQRFEYAIQLVGDIYEADLEWLYNYGCSLDFLGDFRDEEKCYEKAVHILSYVLDEDPEFQAAKYNLGLALSHYGEVTGDLDSIQQAASIFEELIQCDSEDEVVYNDWGVTLIHHAQMIRDPAHMEECQQIFSEAESKLLKALSLGSTTALYNMACLQALIGNLDAATHFLERAGVNRALPPIEDILNDIWLENLRESPQFKHFINQWANLDADGKLNERFEIDTQGEPGTGGWRQG